MHTLSTFTSSGRWRVPRSRVAEVAPLGTLARPSEIGRKVLFRDVLDELGLVLAAEDVDLSDGGLVQPRLDE